MPGIRKAAAGEPASTDERRDLAVRYEQLRDDALAGTGHGWRWGRALLQRQGLAVWIGAWRELAVDTPMPASAGPAAATAVPAGSEQLVAVLAAMALAVTTTTAGGRT